MLNINPLPYGAETVDLDYKFLEWFSGFSDAEGNFNLVLRDFKNNSFSSVMSTFQIGLLA